LTENEQNLRFLTKEIYTHIMLSFIHELTDPLLDYLKDDPVRPEISREFRVSGQRFVSALVEEKPRAMVCVSLHDFVPETVEDLSQDSTDPNTAIFYTIWSYRAGAGRKLIQSAVRWLQSNQPAVQQFVTLSPPTDMARIFHLRNGAQIYRRNEDTVNYIYSLETQ
jgi:hypothetical protein